MTRSSTRAMGRLLSATAALLVVWHAQGLGRQSTGREYDALHYDVALRLDTAAREISGHVVVDFASLAESLAVARFAAGGLRVSSVVDAAGEGLGFEQSGGELAVRLRRPLPQGERSRVRIEYAGRPARGLSIGDEQAFTYFHTSSWLVSNDDPADKSTLTIALTAPAGLRVVASGRALGTELVDGGLARHRFQLDRPYSTYLYGFAAGRWSEVRESAADVRLQHFGAGFSEAELKQIFAATAEMLSFFSRRAGVRYPLDSYTQVLLPDGPPQELAGLSLMSAAYGRAVLADPREDHLIAHELAHQWWGNLVTCRSWSDFWLNEGMATFMVAAFKEHRWGKDEYDRERILARQRYGRAARDGNVRPLVFSGWSQPEDMSGPLTYSRGFLVLHLLRQELGDAAFWDGIERYTTAGAGGSVTSADLQRAMEAAARRRLDRFFRQFVYSGDMPRVTATHRLGRNVVDIALRQDRGEPWQLSFDIAVQTDVERVQRRVTFDRPAQTFRLEAKGRPVSVCVDCTGNLPLPVGHARPPAMLLWQIGSERNLAARADALLALDAACGQSPAAAETPCGDLERIYGELRATTPDRVIAQLAGQLQAARTKPAQ